MIIKIKTAINGAIIVCEDGEEVFEYDEEDWGGLQELHYRLDEMIAPMSSRSSEKRMRHRTVHGDNYECKDKKCRICGEEQ